VKPCSRGGTTSYADRELSNTTLDTESSGRAGEALRAATPTPMLAVLWCASASASSADRVGEVLVADAETRVFGRGGDADEGEGAPRVQLVRQRPGGNARTGPLENPFISRSQMRVTRDGEGVRVENLGKRALLVRGQAAQDGVLGVGDTCELKGQ